MVAKADKLTYRGDAIANKWMKTSTAPEEETDLTTVPAESEDVWAYLSAYEAADRLDPVRRFAPASLHFASAAGTGTDPFSGHTRFYEAGFRPTRVLKPLLALLQAHGVAMQGTGPARGGRPGAAR